MFTSPRQYACKLAYKLIDKGARPVWVPGVEVTDLCETHRQKACLMTLPQCQAGASDHLHLHDKSQ